MKEMVSRWLENLRIEGSPDEWEAKNLLKQAGIPVPEGRRIMPDESLSPDEVSFPLVLKVCDPAILHKTERGGVILNVTKESLDRKSVV